MKRQLKGDKKPFNCLFLFVQKSSFCILYEKILQFVRKATAEEGIDFCINYGNLVAFPRLILNKAIALVQMGNTTEAEKYLHQAITVFEAMKKMDIVEHIRTWCRSHYSIEL